MLESSHYTLPYFPARTGGPAASTSNAHHTNPRQGVCIICQETGHSSNDCPSRSTNVRHHGMSENNGKVSVVFTTPRQFRQSREIQNIFLGYLVCCHRDMSK